MPDCEGFDTLETVIEQYQVLETINEKYSYPAYVLLGLKATTLLIGLSIVFIWKQKDAKPAFVKAIWVLIILAEVAVIANLILYSRLKKLIEYND